MARARTFPASSLTWSHRTRIAFTSPSSKRGRSVSLDGHYTLNDKDDPERHITGTGQLNGEYLSWMYETSINDGGSVTHGVMLIKIQPSLVEADGHYLARNLKKDVLSASHWEMYERTFRLLCSPKT